MPSGDCFCIVTEQYGVNFKYFLLIMFSEKIISHIHVQFHVIQLSIYQFLNRDTQDSVIIVS